MAGQPIKFGILGCADIARKVSRAIILSQNSTLYAVGSRSLEKAAKFAKENGFPESAKVYDSYDAVLDDPDVDVAYVPLPTSLHVKWAVLAAQKKKHLLLEKPVALNVKELDLILEACESSGVQFMDSTMWMHHPRTASMREFLSNSELFGELKSVNSCFTFAANQDFLENDIRVKPDLDAHGALGDAGWYCIRSILWASNFELPKTVLALPGPVFNKAGVIIACSASLYWEDGKVATFHCSFLANLTMDVTVVGTNGTLHLHDFVIPFEEKKASFSVASKSGFTELVTGWEPKPSEHHVTTDLPQEALMVREFSRLVGSIKFDGSKPEVKWPTLSRKTQQVLDAVKLSIERGSETVEEASRFLPEIVGPTIHPKVAQALLERQQPDVALMILRRSGQDGGASLVSLEEAVTIVRVRVECGLLTEAFLYQRMVCTKVKDKKLRDASDKVKDDCWNWVLWVEALVTEICCLCIWRSLVGHMIELPWNPDEEKHLHKCL